MLKALKTMALGAMLALGALGAHAELTDAMKVSFNDGSSPVTVILDQMPVVSFDADNLVIEMNEEGSEERSSISYEFDNVKDFTFAKVEVLSKADKVAAPEVTIVRSGNGFIVGGLNEGDPVTVHSLSGVKVAQGNAGINGQFEWTTSNQQAGVYIMRAGNTTTKIMIK